MTTVQAVAEALDTTPCSLLRGDHPASAASADRDPFVDQVCEAIGRLPPNRLIALAQIVDAIAEAPADASPVGIASPNSAR